MWPITPGFNTATGEAPSRASRRSVASPPVTMKLRRPVSVAWCTQPLMPSGSCTSRQTSNSRWICTGSSRRLYTQSMG